MPYDTADTPVLDTIAAMTAASVERCDLSADALLLVRIAARPPSTPARFPMSRTSARRSRRG